MFSEYESAYTSMVCHFSAFVSALVTTLILPHLYPNLLFLLVICISLDLCSTTKLVLQYFSARNICNTPLLTKPGHFPHKSPKPPVKSGWPFFMMLSVTFFSFFLCYLLRLASSHFLRIYNIISHNHNSPCLEQLVKFQARVFIIVYCDGIVPKKRYIQESSSFLDIPLNIKGKDICQQKQYLEIVNGCIILVRRKKKMQGISNEALNSIIFLIVKKI